MEEKVYSDTDSFYCDKPFRVVNINNPIFKSFVGKYFSGHTNSLSFGVSTNAWAALVNPSSSGINLYVSAVAITNLTSSPFLAQFWLNSTPLDQGIVSSNIYPLNTVINPAPKPNVKIIFNQLTNQKPSDGVNVFSRMIPSTSTIVDEKDGKIIIPQGGNLLIFLQSSDKQISEADVAFEWWEQ